MNTITVFKRVPGTEEYTSEVIEVVYPMGSCPFTPVEDMQEPVYVTKLVEQLFGKTYDLEL